MQEKRLAGLAAANFQLLILDEAHHSTADSYCAVMHALGFISAEQVGRLSRHMGDGLGWWVGLQPSRAHALSARPGGKTGRQAGFLVRQHTPVQASDA